MPKPELEFSLQEDVPWQPVDGMPGAREKILSRGDAPTDYTRLMMFEPGMDTSNLGPLRHDHWEEVYILSGALEDLTLKETFGEGMYACRPPGMPHGPWRSERGCLMLELRYAASGIRAHAELAS